MHFLLSGISVVYVLTTPMPKDKGDNLIVDQVRRRAKWDNDDYVCRGLILNGQIYGSRCLKYNDNRSTRKHYDTKADPNKKPKVTCWMYGKPGHLKKDCKAGNVGNEANGSGIQDSRDGSSNSLKGATVHVCKDRCWFKIYESLNDGSILHMGYELTTLLHEHGCVDLRVWGCRAVVRLPDLKLKTLGERGIECIFVRYAKHSKAFRFFVIEPNDSVAFNSIIESKDAIFDEYRDEVFDKHSYCFNVEDDPKTIDEAMKSYDVSFWREVINDEMDSIMGNNTWVLTDLPPGCKPLGYKWIFKQKLKVDLTKEFLSSRFSMKDMGEAGVILVSTHMDTSEKMTPTNGQAVSQLEYLGYTSNLVLGGYTDASWISNSSISGWVFLLGGGVISWASKKQFCITGLIMESEFVALAAASKEAEWLKNLLLEIPMWVKP
nr:zinc finger, CCHC-type [Tanacetum cinerariifolium]